jgi:hypothetical protein
MVHPITNLALAALQNTRLRPTSQRRCSSHTLPNSQQVTKSDMAHNDARTLGTGAQGPSIKLKDNCSYIRVPGPRLLATAAAIVALSTPIVSLQSDVEEVHMSSHATIMRAIPPANVEHLALRVARVGVDNTSASEFVRGLHSKIDSPPTCKLLPSRRRARDPTPPWYI